MRALLFILIFLIILATFFLWPRADLTVSSWFYDPGNGFPLAHQAFCKAMQEIAFYGARVLAAILLGLTLYTWLRKAKVFEISDKGWLFLFIALLIGPGLIANVILKDHWGRARPREVTEFGGSKIYSAPLIVQSEVHHNGSFVSGDASFGFFLPSFAYVVPRRRHLSRRFFWGGIAFGSLFGICRIVMGAHFLSDVLFAAGVVLAVSAILHACMYGRKATATAWSDWLFKKA